jgi:hypothetical protein
VLMHPSLANAVHVKRELSGARGKEGVVPAFRCAYARFAKPSLRGAKRRSNPGPRHCTGLLRFARNDENKRKRNADRRMVSSCRAADTAAHPARCAHLSAFHRGSCQREISSPRLCFRPCFLGRGGAPTCDSPFRGQHRTQFVRVLPATDLSQSSEAPRAPVRSAGRLMPEAARERIAIPPAGTALAPIPRLASEAGPLVSETRNVT